MRWMLETNGEGNSGKSVLEARHDDDDDDVYTFQWGLEYVDNIPSRRRDSSQKHVLVWH